MFKRVSNLDTDALNVYLESFKEHGYFTSVSNCDNIVRTVNTLINSSQKRHNGLKILVQVLEQCTISTLENNATVWTTLVLKSCNAEELRNYPELIFTALTSLAENVHPLPSLAKDFVSNHLAKIYASLRLVPKSGYLAALKCINSCLRLYPGPSGLSKTIIEQFLDQFTDFADEELIYFCAKCKHLLLQTQGGGAQGTNYKTIWSEYYLKLIKSLESILQEIFIKFNQNWTSADGSNRSDLGSSNFSEEPVERAAQLCVHFRKISRHLLVAIREPFPVPKPILPLKIFNIITHCLTESYTALKDNSFTESFVAAYLLPLVHYQLLELLETLIQVLGNSLKMYHELVLNILVDTLKFSSFQSSSGVKVYFYKIRIKTYGIIALWSSITRYGSHCEIASDVIIEEILKDILLFGNGLNLTIPDNVLKHTSKKARRNLNRFQAIHLAQDGTNSSNNREVLVGQKQNLCVAAFRCLQQFLASSAIFMKPTMIKIIQLKIIFICGSLCKRPLKHQLLYSNWLCRFEAYSTLNVLLHSPHHLHPPPTQIILQILQSAVLSDENSKIRNSVGLMLQSVEKFIHPQKETLLFPLDKETIQNWFEKNGQTDVLKLQYLNELKLTGAPNSNFSDKQENLNVTENLNFVEHTPENSNVETRSPSPKSHKNLTQTNNTGEAYQTGAIIRKTGAEKNAGDNNSFEENINVAPCIKRKYTETTFDENNENNLKNSSDNMKSQNVETVDEDNLMASIASEFVDELL